MIFAHPPSYLCAINHIIINFMAKIAPFDLLYITVINKGIAHRLSNITGINSLADIIMCAKKRLPELSGFTTIDIRNFTGGWTHRQGVLIR